VSVGDSLWIALVPVAFFVVQLASYFAWKQLMQRSMLRKRRYGFGLPPREVESRDVASHA
jgi:hypothetical protein